ncbi:ABC transporter substrate-binding protein [Thiospirillum jenense]|uniref:ABC transporter substrate-binding protein n=1 Tax=Thiospirillum jenense TaxID=1653858 RepID=A0A839H4X9_9GAMM|nr:ABC transporter substrate-binding protein [Thiospirillum jenense]MBB1125103.1 ABC transporter substrate-binding protein [Thiospirillum jenense]
MIRAITTLIWRVIRITTGKAPSRRRFILVYWLVISGCLFGCNSQVNNTTIRFGIADTPRLLDPRFATDAISERLNRLIYQRLIEFDAASQPVPGIATWAQLTPTQYRFDLGQHAHQFSNGERLTAHDVAATYRSVLDPATVSPQRAALANIAAIAVLNDKQIIFHLHRPDRLFPALLGIGILPAVQLATNHDFAHQPIGSGPLQFGAWPTAGRLILQRRSDGQVFEFITVKDPNVRVMKLLRGEVDLLQNDLPPELLAWLKRQPGVTVHTEHGANFSYLGMNLADPHLKSLEVRQALAYAVDRTALVQFLLHGHAQLAQALLTPTHWAGAPELIGYQYDPARARALLTTAGYDATHPLKLSYKTSSDPQRLRMATVIQAQLAAVNVELTIQSYDWGTFFGDIKAGRFQLYGLTWVGVRTPDIFRYAFHSAAVPPAGANRGHYHNNTADALIEKGQLELNETAQAAHYRALQKQLLTDLPVIPLWYEDQVAVMRHTVRGYQVAVNGDYDGLLKVQRVVQIN